MTLVGIILALILFIIASNCIKKMNPPFIRENEEWEDARKKAIWAIQIALCSLSLSAMALEFVIGEFIQSHS